jgi:hypothetical protein
LWKRSLVPKKKLLRSAHESPFGINHVGEYGIGMIDGSAEKRAPCIGDLLGEIDGE